MPKPILPCPRTGQFIFSLKTNKVIPLIKEGHKTYSFKYKNPFGQEKRRNVTEDSLKNSSELHLFFKRRDLYFFLKEKSLLGKYDLSKWSQEKYVQEILWLYDQNHELSKAEINKFYKIYNHLSRVSGFVDWQARVDNENRNLVLGFKRGDEDAFNEAIKFFDDEIESGSAIAAMPSSEKFNWGISGEAAKKLSRVKDRIDCSELLFRFKDSEKQQNLYSAEDRVPETHFNTIRLNRDYLHLDKKYYILDDITTTGVSLNTVKTMLILAGIEKVTIMAFGNTLRRTYY